MYTGEMKNPEIFTTKELVGEVNHYEYRIGRANGSLGELVSTRASLLHPTNNPDNKYRYGMQNECEVQMRVVMTISNLCIYKNNIRRLKAELAKRGATL